MNFPNQRAPDHPSAQINQAGWPREVLESASVACPECRHESTVPLTAHRTYEGPGINDPHFGMPLLPIDAGRHGTVWAYNAEHVDALKATSQPGSVSAVPAQATTLCSRGCRPG